MKCLSKMNFNLMTQPKPIIKKMAVDAKLRNMLLKVPEDHQGFSQRELAKKAGIHRKTIQQIESQAIGKITDYIQNFIREEKSD